MLDDGKYSVTNEVAIQRVRDTIIMQLLLLGHSVIVDDVNLNPKHIQAITNLAQCHCTQIRIIDIDTPIEECIRRDMTRDHPVGAARIREMALPLLGAEKAQSR